MFHLLATKVKFVWTNLVTKCTWELSSLGLLGQWGGITGTASMCWSCGGEFLLILHQDSWCGGSRVVWVTRSPPSVGFSFSSVSVILRCDLLRACVLYLTKEVGKAILWPSGWFSYIQFGFLPFFHADESWKKRRVVM